MVYSSATSTFRCDCSSARLCALVAFDLLLGVSLLLLLLLHPQIRAILPLVAGLLEVQLGRATRATVLTAVAFLRPRCRSTVFHTCVSISSSLAPIWLLGNVTVACRMCSTLTNPGSAMTPAWLSNTAALPWIFKFRRPAAGAPNAFPGPSPYEAVYIRLDMNMLPAAGGSAPMRGKPHPAPAAIISCNKDTASPKWGWPPRTSIELNLCEFTQVEGMFCHCFAKPMWIFAVVYQLHRPGFRRDY